MLIALVADFHGNRPATEALERDLRALRPDRILCLGDVVGKGPCSDYTFDWAFQHCEVVLGGNWDYGVGEKKFPQDSFYYRQLGEERLQKLRELPAEMELWLSGRRVRLFHGRPVMSELKTIRDDESELRPFFLDGDGQPYDAVIYADAHRQALRTLNPGLFVNVGSVGNALGEPRCCYGLVDAVPGKAPAPFEIRLRQVDYPREKAVEDARQAPLVPRIDCFINEVRTGRYSR